MSKFTPGPWEVELMADRDGDWFSIEAPMVGRSGTVADTFNRDSVIDPDENRANAYLMAAGPNLLAACECEDAWEAYARGDGPKSAMTAVLARHGWDGFEPTTKFLDRIRRAAIAKATGS